MPSIKYGITSKGKTPIVFFMFAYRKVTGGQPRDTILQTIVEDTKFLIVLA